MKNVSLIQCYCRCVAIEIARKNIISQKKSRNEFFARNRFYTAREYSQKTAIVLDLTQQTFTLVCGVVHSRLLANAALCYEKFQSVSGIYISKRNEAVCF